eukprot:1388415-Lingulodinium_polyedra.AAC.1
MSKHAVSELLRPWTVGLTASFCSVWQTLHNDAVKSTVRDRSGSQIARLRTARARQFSGARMERANRRAISEPLRRRT